MHLHEQKWPVQVGHLLWGMIGPGTAAAKRDELLQLGVVAIAARNLAGSATLAAPSAGNRQQHVL
jgi:hypothetical protein